MNSIKAFLTKLNEKSKEINEKRSWQTVKWSEISIQTTNEAIEPISNILHEAGASGVVIEDPTDLQADWDNVYGELYELNPNDYPDDGVIIKAYLPVNSFLKETFEAVKESILKLPLYGIDIGKSHLSMNEIDEEEWSTSWKKYYHPVKVSEKCTIVPTWETYEPVLSDEIIIELDPGMAFGTGTHPTTVLCIQALERVVAKQDQVIDVGTGSGVLSIAAAMLGAGKVYALDLDEVAVRVAKENVRHNRCHHIVEVTQNNLLEGSFPKADVIVANILADVIIGFTNEAAKYVKKDGYFIASGIILQKKAAVQEAMIASGFLIEEVNVMEDWAAIIAKRG